MLAHWNNSPRIDMSPHLDTLFRFRANQSLLFLPNAACLAEKQQIPILQSLVWPNRDSNPRSTTLEASTLTIAPSMQLKSTVWKELLNIYNFIHSKHFLDPFKGLFKNMDRDSPSVLSFYIGESNMQKFERKSTKHLLFELDLRFWRHLNHVKTWGFDVTSIILRPEVLTAPQSF